MGDARKPFPDPLVRQRLFPDPAQIFAFSPIRLQGAITDALVVVDTNVLLLPYSTGRASLDQIRSTYERLTKENRLRIPGQVAREFAGNRADKIKTLFQQLSRKRDMSIPLSRYPLLEGNPEYAEVTRREGELSSALDEYRKAIGALLDTISGWQWDDPVSQMYRACFKPGIVVDPAINREKCLEELRYRQEHRVPPGFKDAGNEYSGVGDFLIWKTILDIGEKESRHLIFVSGDEKTDWRYQSENRALYPRIELLEEYRVASKDKSFLIIGFAELLEQFGAPQPVVEEVRKEEAVASRERSDLVRGLEGTTSDGSLSPKSLGAYLVHRYPERRQSSLREHRSVLRELRSCGIETLNDLERMLKRSERAFEVAEKQNPPRSGRYAAVGVVRVSLAIVDDRAKHGEYHPSLKDWRLLLEPDDRAIE